MSYIPEQEFNPPKRPGNYGGETLRQYCGLSRFRVDYAFKERFDEGRITTQRLYIAIGKHAKRKGGAK